MDKKYESCVIEKRMQDFWEQEKIYALENNLGQLYSIDTPPPTVSGSLHIGHLFSYTQTDIIARYKRMSGFSVFYPFGFDDNGLPTERYVEKKLNISAHKTGRSEFIKKCLEVTNEVEQQFKNLWQSMGLSVDWTKCYSTMSTSVRKLSQESFIRLFKEGYIYRRYEPSLYCATCRTSVAQAELDDQEQQSFFNDIVFTTEEGKEVIIGTTRPELLPSCVALLYHPKDIRYKELKNKKAVVPVFGHSVPIFEDEQVEIEKGTGLVMVCSFGDKSDMEWIKKFELPYKQSIGFDGKMMNNAGILSGLKVKEAREKILEELENKKIIINKKSIIHMVNVHERCKKNIEIIALPQWFLKILDNKQKFLDLADKINWHPSFMKTRYVDWVEHISWDWCLSRQRFYGIPFPVWHCQDCEKSLIANLDILPVDPRETSYPEKECPSCNSQNIIPDNDVMDTWNTSSITPYILYPYYKKDNGSPFDHYKVSDFIPMNMRPQAHDIIRTWAFYTIVKTFMHHKTIPWKDIVISGHVLSSERAKISKSKGGSSVAPDVLIKNYSADVIRYWTASGGLGKDISFSENQIKIGQKLITKLWNAFIFVQSHVDNIKVDCEHPKTFGIVNEWILHEASKCYQDYKKHFRCYEFGLALQQIEKFFWSEFCDNYLEMVKDQLFNPSKYDIKEVRATKLVLYKIGLRILQLYAPYVPHVTEFIYQAIYKSNEKIKSLHHTKFAQVQKDCEFKESSRKMEFIINIASQIRKLKTQNKLSLKTDLDSLGIYSKDTSILNELRKYEQLIMGITNAHIIDLRNEKLGESKLEKIGNRLKAIIRLED